jgi:hypothetical protein
MLQKVLCIIEHKVCEPVGAAIDELRATSIAGLRSHQSAMAACFVFWREINFVHSAGHRNVKFNLMVSADYEPT